MQIRRRVLYQEIHQMNHDLGLARRGTILSQDKDPLPCQVAFLQHPTSLAIMSTWLWIERKAEKSRNDLKAVRDIRKAGLVHHQIGLPHLHCHKFNYISRVISARASGFALMLLSLALFCKELIFWLRYMSLAIHSTDSSKNRCSQNI